MSFPFQPKKNEHYLTPEQLNHFKERLLKLREEHQEKMVEEMQNLPRESLRNEPDLLDRASIETDRSLSIQTHDREQKLIFEINQALARIEKGVYGYCEETGEPIGFSRLEAYPMATLSLEAQALFEKIQKNRK